MLHRDYQRNTASPAITDGDKANLRSRRVWLLINAPGRGYDTAHLATMSDAKIKECADERMCDQMLDNHYRAMIGLKAIPTTPAEDLTNMRDVRWSDRNIQVHQEIRALLGIAPLPVETPAAAPQAKQVVTQTGRVIHQLRHDNPFTALCGLHSYRFIPATERYQRILPVCERCQR